jgi:hypothetical protein
MDNKMDNNEYREQINSNLMKLQADKKASLINIHSELLQINGASKEEIDKINELVSEEGQYFEKIKYYRDQILAIVKSTADEKENTENANSEDRKTMNIVKEIQFNHLNKLMKDCILGLLGIKTLLILQLNTLSTKYNTGKPMDIINLYGIDAWNGAEEPNDFL